VAPTPGASSIVIPTIVIPTIVTPTTTVTTLALTTGPPTTTTAAMNYGQQYLADVAPVNTALGQLGANATLASAGAQAAGQQAVNTGRLLLTQTWPSGDEPDIHNLGVEFETIDADIAADNFPKFRDDVTTLDADANVVRAELGLAAIK
jgi:hypothetical protein